jgi:hypothetical protein
MADATPGVSRKHHVGEGAVPKPCAPVDGRRRRRDLAACGACMACGGCLQAVMFDLSNVAYGSA